MIFIKNLINIVIQKFFKLNREKSIKAKKIMIDPEIFNINNLKLVNTFKVNEEVLVKDFISKIVNDKLTIIVIDKRGQTKGYIDEEQINLHFDILNNHEKTRTS